jgi:integration host factor subunit alpha
MMTLTKAEISEKLFQQIGLTKREAKEVVELFFEKISKALEGGQNVKLSKFGNFELHDKSERPGRNPKTGELIPVTARRVVTHRSGQKLRARVELYAGKDANAGKADQDN